MTIVRRQYLAYGAAVALLMGVFAPVVSAPMIGSMTLLHYSSIAGILTIALALATGYFAFQQRFKLLLYVGIVALAIPLYVVGRYEYAMHYVHQQLGGKNDIFSGLANAIAGTVELQWGVMFLILVSAAIIGAALLRGPAGEEVAQLPPVNRRALIIAGAIIVTVALVAIGYTVAQGFLVANVTVTSDNRDQIIERVANSYLSDTDKNEFSAAITRSISLTGTYDPNGKTVRRTIDEQKAFEAAEARAKAERKATEAALKGALQVTLTDKSFQPSDFESGVIMPQLRVSLSFKNTGNKAIRAFKGVIVIRSLLGTVFNQSNLEYDQPIAVGATVIYHGSRDYNQFEAGDQKLKDTSLKDLKTDWQPQSIVFADGTRLDINPSQHQPDSSGP